ncbi:hypothetical protein EVAR_95963_1 [Eumeta japonica]|uniref:PiggyBac transposable element-derived protein domain-containing protein n=1 Tax=Eumeta variegata TaxID=151549 RepID=A0A4C1V7K4_EUMVA|nr:hypothetical protein EVAR_95963_1 [Eumeta japonica]
MSRRTRRLGEKEIEKYLFEDIPSGNESICSCENDEEEAENQPNSMVLGDLIGVQIAHDDIYDSDHDLPLSSRLQRNPDSTESNNGSSNVSVMIAPKWKKNYRMDIPDDKHLQRGQHDYRVSDTKVNLLKWKDKRSVFILSNYHDPKNVGKVKRRERDGISTEVSCPQAVIDYNANMNFVDKFDQCKGSYELQSSSRPDLDKLMLKEFRQEVYRGLLAPAYVRDKHRPDSVYSSRNSAVSSPGPAFIKRHKRHSPSGNSSKIQWPST